MIYFSSISYAKDQKSNEFYIKDILSGATLEKNIFKAKSPLYKKYSTYQGYDFLNLLTEKKIDIYKSDMIIVEAKDGFKINIPSAFVIKYKPFLATRDLELPKNRDWAMAQDGGRAIDGGPYYLMWPENNKIPKNYWSFGSIKITLSSFKEAYGLSVPKNTSNLRVMQGFQVYQTSCAGCHSVNFSGGEFAPEMNVPQNFTEYLGVNFIRKYVLQPQNFRANAKMPPQSISSDDIDAVLDYMREMRKYKVCSSKEDCLHYLKNSSK